MPFISPGGPFHLHGNNGRRLENERTLSECGIKDGLSISLFFDSEFEKLRDASNIINQRDSKSTMTLFIKTLTGETIDLKVETSEAIADLKVRIWDKIGVHPSQ